MWKEAQELGRFVRLVEFIMFPTRIQWQLAILSLQALSCREHPADVCITYMLKYDLSIRNIAFSVRPNDELCRNSNLQLIDSALSAVAEKVSSILVVKLSREAPSGLRAANACFFVQSLWVPSVSRQSVVRRPRRSAAPEKRWAAIFRSPLSPC